MGDMTLKLYGPEFHEILIEATYPGDFNNQDDEIVEREYSGDLFFGKGFYKEFFFEGIHIGYGNLELKHTTLLHFESDFQSVEMHFALSGDKVIVEPNFKQEVQFSYNQHNIIYANGFSGKTKWSSRKDLKIFEINLLPAFFKKYLPEEILEFNQFSKNIEKGRSSQLSKHPLRITPQMHILIHEIIACHRTGKFKKMFIEAKVIELLLLQLEQMSEHDCEVFCSLKKSDIEKMYTAKEIILNHLTEPFSLLGLAQMVGTNEFTLKKGFKEIFGTTVFGFWHQIKMEEAKKLLLNGSMTVAETADYIGYKNPQHFSTAFKKYFGMSPSQLKH